MNADLGKFRWWRTAKMVAAEINISSLQVAGVGEEAGTTQYIHTKS